MRGFPSLRNGYVACLALMTVSVVACGDDAQQGADAGALFSDAAPADATVDGGPDARMLTCADADTGDIAGTVMGVEIIPVVQVALRGSASDPFGYRIAIHEAPGECITNNCNFVEIGLPCGVVAVGEYGVGSDTSSENCSPDPHAFAQVFDNNAIPLSLTSAGSLSISFIDNTCVIGSIDFRFAGGESLTGWFVGNNLSN